MSVRWADARFVLAHPPQRVVVLGDLVELRQAVAEAGIAADRDDVLAAGPPDLVITTAKRWAEASALRPRALMALGRVRRPSRPGEQASGAVTRLLARPDHYRPRLLVPLGDRAVVGYALGLSVPPSRPKAASRRAVVTMAPRGAIRPRSLVTINQSRPGPPFLVAAAGAIGIPDPVRWSLSLGRGDDLQRGVFHLFGPGEARPAWVLKFARLPGYRRPFDDDEAGMTALATRAPSASARGPRLLGRLVVDGLHASVESAAPGRPLSEVLDGPDPEATKRTLIDGIASWVVDMGRESRSVSGELEPELARLRDDVAPAWGRHPAASEAMAALDGGDIPGVLQHNDLGSWNIAVDGSAFTVLDWESARPVGLPLWDLVYFLTDALVSLQGPASVPVKLDRMLSLLRGQAGESAALFAHLRLASRSLGLPPDIVGPIVTLGWMQHGLSEGQRLEARGRAGGSTQALSDAPPLGRLAPAWFGDPALGPAWKAWLQASRQ